MDNKLIREEINTLTKKLTSLDNGEVISRLDLINRDNWFTDKDIKIDTIGNHLIFNSQEDKKQYISYLHKQMSFSKPIIDDGLFISPRSNVHFKWTTEESDKDKGLIYIIEYNEKERLNTHTVKANEDYYFQTHEETRNVRLVFKINNNTKVTINNIKFEKIHTILNQPKDNIEELEIGRLTPKNTLLQSDKTIALLGTEYLQKSLERLLNVVNLNDKTTNTDTVDFVLIESSIINENNVADIKTLINKFRNFGTPIFFWIQDSLKAIDHQLLEQSSIILGTNSKIINEVKKINDSRLVELEDYVIDYTFTNPIGRYKNLSKVAMINVDNEIQGVDSYTLNKHNELKIKGSKTSIGNQLTLDTAILYKYYDIVILGEGINHMEWERKKCFASHTLPIDLNKKDLGLGIDLNNEEFKLSEILALFKNNDLLSKKIIKENKLQILEGNLVEAFVDRCYKLINQRSNFYILPKATAVVPTIREYELERIKYNLSNQTYENLECIVVLNKDSMDLNHWKNELEDYNITVLQVSEDKTLGEVMNVGFSHSNGDILFKMDDDDHYGINYVKDLVYDFKMSNAEIIGKRTHYFYVEDLNLLALKNEHFNQYEESKFIAGGTFVLTQKVFNELGRFSQLPRGIDTDLIKKAIKNDKIIMTSDEAGYSFLRRKSKESHTWNLNDFKLLKEGSSKAFTKDYRSIMDY